MTYRNKFLTYAFAIALLLSMLEFTAAATRANDRAFSAVATHLKTRYRARERRIPFQGLANFAVKLARPAGVKSFKVMIFEDLHETTALAGGAELNAILSGALGKEWQPLARIYSRQRNEQTYVYAAAEGKNIKLMIVSLQQAEATLARVKLNPDALVRFINEPKILGISLASNQR
jgi:hypothetical protein